MPSLDARSRLVALIVFVAALAFPGQDPARWPVAEAQSISARGVVSESAPRVPGDIIVKYRTTTASSDRASVLSAYGLRHVRSIDAAGLHLLRSAPGEEMATIRRLQADPRIELAEPNYRRRIMAAPADPEYPQQYSFPLIGMEQAWNISTGSSSIVTAVLDTGIDFGHPDLAGRIANLTGSGLPGASHVFLSDPSPTCAPVSAPDDDGWLGVTQTTTHGTHVAGTIAANSTLAGGPAIGVTGVAPSTRVAPLKTQDCEGSGTTFDVAAAITFAANNGARVINMSLGASDDNPTCNGAEQTAIDLAYSRNVVVVAAAGNDGTTNRSDPAICNHVIGVGATDIADSIASFSQHNSTVDVSAPGVSIISTYRETDGSRTYHFLQGTSMATPHVAGCAALILSVNPALNHDQVEALLRNTALDLGAPGRDDFFGSGRLDCGAAVLTAANVSFPTRTPTPTAGAGTPGGACASVGTTATQASRPPSLASVGGGTRRTIQVVGQAQTQPAGILAVPPGWTAVTCESFESPWPRGAWQAFDNDASTPTGGTCWGVSTFQVRFGTRAAWPAAGCDSPLNPATTNYPDNLDSWALFGPFSLADAQAAQIQLTVWSQLSSGDVLFIVVSTDGRTFSGTGIAGSSTASPPPTPDGWQAVTLNLGDPDNGVDILGAPQVYFALVFQSNGSGRNRGVFVDDVLITKRSAAVGTPTPTRTTTAPGNTPTSTTTQTATPTGTATHTATATSTQVAVTQTPTATGGATCTLRPQGDANCDGRFTLSDYTVWRNQFLGTDPNRTADFNGDTRITLTDYTIWRNSFLSASAAGIAP